MRSKARRDDCLGQSTEGASTHGERYGLNDKQSTDKQAKGESSGTLNPLSSTRSTEACVPRQCCLEAKAAGRHAAWSIVYA